MNFDREEPSAPDEITAVDHRKLPRPNAQQGRTHPEEVKAFALSIYAETGSVDTAARESNLPPTTVRNWIDRDPEIDAKLEALRRIVRERTAHTYAEVAYRAAQELLDRVNHGDYHIDKEGNTTRRPIPGRELAFISSIAADKHALLTASVVKQRGEDSSLAKLADGLISAIEKRGLRAKADAALPHDGGQNSAD